MTKRIFLFICTVVLITAFAQLASAQSDDEKKFEVGGQVSAIRVPTFSLSSSIPILFSEERVTNWGFGGRLGYNFNRHVGIEGELNYFPQDNDLEGGRKLQGLLGVKAGQRFDKVGV